MLKSKQTASFILVILVLLSGLPVGYASDYRDTARDFLAEELSVSADSINVDGSVQDFPYIGKEFWVGRYFVNGDGVTGRVPDRTREDVPVPSDYDTIEPALPEPGIEIEPVKAGTIIIGIESGEIFIGEDAEAIMREERKLQQEEWEQLSKEAGNISVDLYRQVTDASSDTLFEVLIHPRYVETREMLQVMESIIDEYPDLQFADPGYPGLGTDGRESSETGDGEITILPAPAEPRDLPENYPDEPVSDRSDDITGGNSDEALEMRERYEEMYRRLKEIRMQGFTESLNSIEATLQEMNVEYDVDPQMPTAKCELTSSQILSLKDADYLESITEELHFTTMADDLAVAGEAESARVASVSDEDNNLLWWLLPGMLIVGVASIYLIARRRRQK